MKGIWTEAIVPFSNFPNTISTGKATAGYDPWPIGLQTPFTYWYFNGNGPLYVDCWRVNK